MGMVTVIVSIVIPVCASLLRFHRWHVFGEPHLEQSMTQKGKIWIGTSNITLPGNKSTFPKEFRLESRLHYYSSLFNTLEVNSSFYRIPLRNTFQRWAFDVQNDFCFSLKLTKEITHARDLAGDMMMLEKFMDAARGISQKRGCILVQFPGKISLEHFGRVEQILENLMETDPHNTWRKAIEFRNKTWYLSETYEMLNLYGAQIVLHDMPKSKLLEAPIETSFLYLRFHGPNGDYRGSYSIEILKQRALQIEQATDQGRDVYVYFNNTVGEAFNNALTLKKLLRKVGRPKI